MSADKKAKYTQLLAETRQELTTLLTSLTDEQLNTAVITEGNQWTVLDTVAHLVENERGMSIHIYKARQGRETVPAGFDVHQWNEGLKGRMDRSSLPELLQAMEETRAKTLEGLQSLSDEEWALQGRHPVEGMITVEQYYQTMAGHDQHHLADIRRGLGLNS